MSLIRSGAMLLFAGSLYASPVFFLAAGVSQDGSILSGNVVIDTATGTVNSLSLTMSSPSSFTVSSVAAATGQIDGSTFLIGGDNGTTYPRVHLIVPVSINVGLVGYAGGSLCSFNANCGGFASSANGALNVGGQLTSASLTAAAATPEPESAVLIGTALSALALLRRRRGSQA